MRYVVIDTNCLLRMIPIRSKYRQAWEAFLNGEYVLCVSNEIISEYEEIFSEKVSSQFANNIITAILRNPCTRRYDPQYHFSLISQDADDNKLHKFDLSIHWLWCQGHTGKCFRGLHRSDRCHHRLRYRNLWASCFQGLHESARR